VSKRAKAPAPKPRASRSGSNLSDARRAELGYGRLTLRLPLDVLEALTEESESSGLARWELVDSAIRLYVGTDELAIACRAGCQPLREKRPRPTVIGPK
jgi:hypothetical protein